MARASGSKAQGPPEFYQRLYEYNRKVLEGYLNRYRRIGRRAARKDRGTGIGSMHDTLLHIVRVHDAWVNYIVQGDLEGLRRSHEGWVKAGELLDPPTYFRDTWRRLDPYLRSLTPKELSRTVKAPWMPGRYTVADALMQCTFEQAHHLGEIIGAFWRENKASPQMMWIPTLTGKKVSVD